MKVYDEKRLKDLEEEDRFLKQLRTKLSLVKTARDVLKNSVTSAE